MKPLRWRLWRRLALLSAALALPAVLLPARTALAARPAAPKLLPENTILVLSVADAPDLVKRFMNTGMGRMSEDPKLKPLIKDLYGSVTDLVANLKEQVGLSLQELLAIPQGEMTLALVAPESGPPALVLLLDAGGQLSNARKLLARGTEEVQKRNPEVTKKEEDIEGTKVVIYGGVGPRRRTAAYFEKDGTLVLGSDLGVLKQVLAAWAGKEGKHLSDNQKYTAIMRRCRGGKDEAPQFFWFFDPISLMKKIGEQNTQVRIAVATLPALGLDGVLGMGGSFILDAGQFDSIVHFHLLLDNPRDGIVEMIALTPGDVKPESWVPPDVVSYTTAHWRFQTTLKNVATLYDSFRGQGGFSQLLKQRVLETSGVDLENDILPALEGRITHFNWIDRTKPIDPQSNSTLVGLKLKETEPVAKTLEGLAKKYEQVVKRRSFAGVDFYQVIPPDRPRRKPDPDRKPDPNRPEPKRPEPNPDAFRPRPPQPCLGILGDYLIVTDRSSTFEKVIATLKSGKGSLADELEFKLIAAKIARQCGGTKPAMISFNRPEEGMRFLYDLATADQTRSQLRRRAEDNAFFGSVQTALEKNSLPPFAVLQQYLAPGGAMVIDDDSGIHYTGFTLRRKPE